MNQRSETLPTAGVIRRLAAMVYDSLLVFGVLFTATLPTVFLQPAQDAAIANEQVVNELPNLVDGWPFQLYLLAVYGGFFCWFWMKNGQTLGMQAWRLRIENDKGQTIAFHQCLLRLLGAVISCLLLGAGYWWIWIDKQQLSWHDRLSKSRVVVLPKKQK
jgi:uncharacterized RDD family membrane protein YckC